MKPSMQTSRLPNGKTARTHDAGSVERSQRLVSASPGTLSLSEYGRTVNAVSSEISEGLIA